MSVQIKGHEAQLLHTGEVLLFGGENFIISNPEVHKTAELYNPKTGNWMYTGSMKSKRMEFASVLLNNGNVLAIGGESEYFSGMDSCEIYDIKTRTWHSIRPMNEKRRRHAALALPNGKVRMDL